MTPEAVSLILSAGCGAIAIILLGIRNAIHGGMLINILADILWWLVSLGLFVLCMWETVDFRVRFFHIIGFGTGAVLAYFTVGRIVTVFAGWLFRVIFKILLTPWAFLYKIVIVLISKVVGSNSRKVAENDSPKRQDC